MSFKLSLHDLFIVIIQDDFKIKDGKKKPTDLICVCFIPVPPAVSCGWTGFIYDSGCQIYCKWFRFKPGFKVPAHQSTMPQINMIPHPVTLYWHWDNQSCS